MPIDVPHADLAPAHLTRTDAALPGPAPADRAPAGQALADAVPAHGELSEAEAWAVLGSVPGLGTATLLSLIAEHGTANHVLELASTAAGRRRIRDGPCHRRGHRSRRRAVTSSDPATAPDLASDDAPRRFRPAPVLVDAIGAAAEHRNDFAARLRSAGLVVLTTDDPAYPPRLRAIEEPPPILFVRGPAAILSAAHAVAVVGTRRPTDGGRRIAARIGDALARLGVVVVSGLAVGIDGATHAAAVAADRPTVAVLGSGHDRLFPRAHAALADAILAAGGAVVSEFGPDAHATRGTFPRRNRVISGLAEATIVVEAAARSGALITARWALEQSREAFFVPGSIDAPASAGCLAFLRAYPGQARVVAGIAELVEDLGLTRPSPTRGTHDVASAATAQDRPSSSVRSVGREALLASLGAAEACVAASLADGAATLDELAAMTDLPVATILGAITLLEIRGFAVGTYGRYRPSGPLAALPPRLP